MNNILKKIRLNLLLFLPICVLFDAYKIASIGNFDITTSVIFILLIIFLSLVLLIIGKEKIKLNINFFIVIIMLSFIMFNYIISENASINSVALSCFFFLTYIITNYEVNENKFNKYIYKLSNLITIISAYSIYQFIGRQYGLPFSNLWINGYMAKGFNWSNLVYFSTTSVYRSNGIFKEPSFLSQYAALAILIIIAQITITYKVKYIVYICVNIFAMILSMSGTGIIILFLGLILLLFKLKNKRKIIGVFFIISFICIISVGAFGFSSIVEHMISRVNEVKLGVSSGGARFTLAFKALLDSLSYKPLTGNGIGAGDKFLLKLNFATRVTTDNNFSRIGIELGIIGLIIWILFEISLYCRENKKNIFYNIIFIFIILSNITGDSFLSASTWAFIYFINVKFKE